MADILPRELPPSGAVNPNAVTIVDNGTQVVKATPIQIVDSAIPLASQAEAESGTNNVKRMTPLRVAQAISILAPSVSNILDDGLWSPAAPLIDDGEWG